MISFVISLKYTCCLITSNIYVLTGVLHKTVHGTVWISYCIPAAQLDNEFTQQDDVAPYLGVTLRTVLTWYDVVYQYAYIHMKLRSMVTPTNDTAELLLFYVTTKK